MVEAQVSELIVGHLLVLSCVMRHHHFAAGLTIPGIAVALYMLLVHVAGPRYKAQLVASGKLDKVADNTVSSSLPQ